MVLVDSSVWIEAFRRNGRLEVKVGLEGLLEAYEAQWCSSVRLEVLGGARHDERARLGEHFSVIPYRICTERDWDRAVALAWRIRDRGVTIPWLDVLIAATALHDGVRLYAIDAHFRAIAEITGLRLYEPGYGGSFMPDTSE
ncbi:MAG: PIN domain-containing protein [Chthoniobacteraceae bacterium]